MASLDFEREKNAFREYYGVNYPKFKAAEETFRALMTSLLAGHEDFPSPVVSSRLKDREESIRKFTVKYQTDLEEKQREYEIKDYITDLLGIRVTCYYETDIPHISRILEDNFEIIGMTDKTSTLQSKDDVFGYKGLHFDLKINSERQKLPEYKLFADLRVEIQIRTIIQHAWSELDHKIKYKKSPPAALKRKINRLAALFELADQEFVNIKIDTEERERSIDRNGDKATISSTSQDELTNVTKTLLELIEKYSGSEEKSLDAFQFLAIARRKFLNYEFIPFRVDGFVQDIHRLAPEFTQHDLNVVINKHLEQVQKYAEYQLTNHFNLNPYTIIRHAIYLSNKNKFSSILFDRQRIEFEKWLKSEPKK